MFCCVLFAFGFSAWTAGSCEFLVYDIGNDATDADIVILTGGSDGGTAVNVTTATIGFARWNPNYLGCRRYDVGESRDIGTIDASFLAGRIGSMLATLLGALAFVLLFVEIVFCRFLCSRLSTIICVFLAFVCQALTFVAYTGAYCVERGGAPSYRCSYGAGSTVSIIATGLFLLSLMLACNAAKSKPLLMIFMERRKGDEIDDCCWICTKLGDRRAERRLRKAREDAQRRKEEEERKEQENVQEEEEKNDIEQQRQQAVIAPIVVPQEPGVPVGPAAVAAESAYTDPVETPPSVRIANPAVSSVAYSSAGTATIQTALDVSSITPPSAAARPDPAPPSPTAATTDAPPQLSRTPPYRKRSFANPEIVEQDMFFDSKN